MEPWTWVGIVVGVLTIVGLIGRFMVSTTKAISKMGETKTKEGFDAGTHASAHETLDTHVGAAHVKIRVLDSRVDKLEASDEASSVWREGMTKRMDASDSKLDRIIDILLKK
jgi:hypothetical protein